MLWMIYANGDQIKTLDFMTETENSKCVLTEII